MTNNYKQIKQVLSTPITKEKKQTTVNDLPPELRGPPQNRYRGYQTQRLRGFRGNTYGPAGPVRRFTPEECKQYEKELRAREGREQPTKPSPKLCTTIRPRRPLFISAGWKDAAEQNIFYELGSVPATALNSMTSTRIRALRRPFCDYKQISKTGELF